MVMMAIAMFSARIPFASALKAVPLKNGQATKQGPTTKPTTTPGYPNVMFPSDATWSTQKAPPKDSLASLPTPQNDTAVAWKLNVIELVHWMSFPLGFFVAHYVFVNSEVIVTALGGDVSRVFFITLGLLCQVFGGGISGNLMASSAVYCVRTGTLYMHVVDSALFLRTMCVLSLLACYLTVSVKNTSLLTYTLHTGASKMNEIAALGGRRRGGG